MLTKAGFQVYSALAVDPGGTTGLAWVRYGSDYMDGRRYAWRSEVEPVQVWAEICDHFDVCIVEQFNSAGPGTKYSGPTLMLIGGIHALCWKEGITYVTAYPTQRMAFVERAKNKIGKDGDIHALTALAHLFRWEEHTLA